MRDKYTTRNVFTIIYYAIITEIDYCTAGKRIILRELSLNKQTWTRMLDAHRRRCK